MPSESSLTRRVTRLENDVESIYEILTEVKATQDGHTQTLDGHTQTLAAHSLILATHSRILDEHTQTLAEHTRTLDAHSRILAEHTGRFDRIDGVLEEVLRRLPEPS